MSNVNKVEYFGKVLIDLSEDTVESSSLLSGYTAHKKDGTSITGSLAVNNFRTGTSEPSDSLGNNGDLYLVIGG